MKILIRMIIPALLALVALGAAGVVAFGAQPQWITRPHGLALICFSYRWSSFFFVFSVILALLLIGGVMARRFALGWLIVIPLVLLVLGQKLAKPQRGLLIVDNPPVMAIESAPPGAEDAITFSFADQSWAVGLSRLDATAVLFIQERDRRAVLLYAPSSQRAIVCPIDRELKARDLQFVCTPAGAPLVYDRRLGQFINTLTGLTPSGARPVGLHAPLEVSRQSAAAIRASRPQARWVDLPLTAPVTTRPSTQVARRYALLATTQPVAVPSENIEITPANVTSGTLPIVLTREMPSGMLRAFDRHIEEDLAPRFLRNDDPKRIGVWMVDQDSNTGFSINGIAIDGPHKGLKLRPLFVSEMGDVADLKHWLANLDVIDAARIVHGNPQRITIEPTTRRTRTVRRRTP